MRRLLLTGAAGRIGTVLRGALRTDVRELRLADREPLGEPAPNEICAEVDLRDLAAVLPLVDGVDAVVHLAAIPGEAAFPDILDTNIRTTYHVLEAARRCGVSRVVLASSNHATGMYPPDVRVDPDMPPRPDSFYGVGKVCDEALARLYAEKFHLEVACLRIGTFTDRPRDERTLATWLSHRDAISLVRSCLQAPDLGFAVVYGVSANTRSWWDNPQAERVGYRPVDDAEEFAGTVQPSGKNGRETSERAGVYQGGPLALPEASIFDAAAAGSERGSDPADGGRAGA